jgi:alpha-beta hydrolase superfamily lysophospholipase
VLLIFCRGDVGLRKENFSWKDPDGIEIFVYVCRPPEDVVEKGVVQISHGMGETASRYQRFAQYLTEAGYIVYANDHRGHGRTALSTDKIGILGKDGFSKMFHDMAILTERIHEKHSHLPVFLFAHSMGSFLAQKYMYVYPFKVKGVILSGTNGKQGFNLNAGMWLATLECWVFGENHRSKLLDKLSFGAFNAKFKPNRTAFDWLSRDEDEVNAYIENPNTGKIFSSGFFRDFFKLLIQIHQKKNINHIPKDLPIFVISGDSDPVGFMGKGVRQLLGMYQESGLMEVTSKIYPGARHEILNELNRDEVHQDILNWLNVKTKNN